MIRNILHLGKRFLTFIWINFAKIIYIFAKQKEDIRIIEKHNLYKGKSCFIVATGPSLCLEDLELIKDCYSFSMNGIVDSFAKTKYRPTFYMIQDGAVVDKIYEKINNSDISEVYAGVGNSYFMHVNGEKRKFKKIKKELIYFNHNSNYHYYEMVYKPLKSKLKFSENFSSQAFDGYTIALSAIQFAYYLGFSKIYLLGCDCTLSGKHFYDQEADSNEVTPNQPLIRAYATAKEFLDSKGIDVINCTRGGALNIFERKNIEDVIENVSRKQA